MAAPVRRSKSASDSALHLNLEGLALLRARLRAANSDNPEFDAQWSRLLSALNTALERLHGTFGPQIERVVAAGDWAREGIDLRNLPFEEVVLRIVLRSPDRPYALYRQVAREVFADLDDEAPLIQFTLETLPEWRRAQAAALARPPAESPEPAMLIRA